MPNERSFLSASPRGRRRRARRGATFQLAAIGWSQAFLSRADYDADENLRLALIYLIQVIGEAGRHVSREFCDQHPEVPWADIVGMRHKVVHDYLGVDEDIVWQVVTGDLPKLAVPSNGSCRPCPVRQNRLKRFEDASAHQVHSNRCR